jgi:hypothetical protein
MSRSGQSILPSHIQDLPVALHPSGEDYDMEAASEVTVEGRPDKRRAIQGPGHAQYDAVCRLCPQQQKVI